jgi:DEAD/DEAH box helicase domain-containing protein
VRPGTFLSALERAPRRAGAPPSWRRRGAPVLPPPDAGPASTPRSPRAGLDTLLPGYAARPHASPAKPSAPSALFDELRAELRNAAAEPAGEPERRAPPPAKRRRAAPATPPAVPAAEPLEDVLLAGVVDDAIAGLPLPPPLARLAAAFERAAAAWDFLARGHLPPTAANLAAALAGLGPGAAVAAKELALMAALCPAAVAVHGRAAAADRAYEESWRRRPAPAAAAAAEAGGDGVADVAAAEATMVTFQDPWQLGRGPLPAAFLAEARRRRPLAGLEAAPGGEEGEESEEGEAPPRGGHRTSRRLRQLWAFRRAAVAAMALLQAEHLREHPPPATAAAPSPAAAPRRSRTGKQRAAEAAAAAPPAEVPAPSAVELLRGGAWHTAFPWRRASLEAVRGAAARLSAAREAARAAAAAATDALVAARGGGRAPPDAPPRLMKRHPPCRDATRLEAPAFLEHLKALPWYNGQVVHVEPLPAREARFAPLPPELPPALAAAVPARLWAHQAKAIGHLLAGRHSVVATPTASGKSLCYALPIFAAIAADRAATAICVFPTKALAQDQLRALSALAAAAFPGPNPPAVEILDGDTPREARDDVRARAAVLLTNPDMLSMAILPAWRQHARLLANLRFLVLDEAHAYRGAFGCHTALVVRRLRRLAAAAGGEFVCAATSATIANPREHAASLLGVPPNDIELVDDDGSPAGAKDFVLWNPPLLPQAAAAPPRRGRSGALAVDPAALEIATTAPLAEAPLPAPRELTVHERLLAARAAAAISAITYSSTRPLAALPARGAPPPAAAGGRPLLRRGGPGAPAAAAEAAAAQARLPTGSGWRALVSRGGAAAPAPPPPPRRASPIVEVALLLAECVQHSVRTIAFCRTRKLCELVVAYSREALAAAGHAPLAGRVAVYRAGYSAAERREVEAALGAGALVGVAATSALELGVDVGGLDCTLHLGVPGAVASLRQQAGRAGRRGQRALAILVPWASPMDQHFLAAPARLFGAPVEAARADASNAGVLAAHAACAAFEAPLDLARDAAFFGPGLAAAAAALLARGVLARHPTQRALLAYAGAAPAPAAVLSLRAIDPERVRVVNATNGAVLEEIELSKAFFAVYDGAVYMHQGRTYLCSGLDLATLEAAVRPADIRYYTSTVDATDIAVAGGRAAFPPHLEAAPADAAAAAGGGGERTSARCGRALVTTRCELPVEAGNVLETNQPTARSLITDRHPN